MCGACAWCYKLESIQQSSDKGHDNRLIELFFGINSAHSRSHQVKITHNYSLACVLQSMGVRDYDVPKRMRL